MKEDTKTRILDVSLQLSHKYGFWSFKVEDILKYAHISRATFYKYFDNKQDVLDTLFDNEMDKIESSIMMAVKKESNSFDKLSAFFRLDIQGVRELFDTLNIRFGEIHVSPGMPRERIEVKDKKDYRIIAGILSEGVRDGSLVLEDMDITARAVIGINRMIAIRSVMENKDVRTVEREIDVALRAIFFGISGTRKG
jgi:AcrR family transcriptional regulator